METTNKIQLRPYQKECIDIINERMRESHEGKPHRDLIAIGTGLGKTVTFSHIDRPGRTLILSHRDELVRQPQRYYDGISFGVEKADEYAKDEEVVSASVQTLCHDERLGRFRTDEFYTIIIDEAHHAAAPTYRKILEYFSGAKYILGVTATPNRGDGVRLSDSFDDIIFIKDLRWGIENHYLSELHSLRVQGHFSLKNVHKVAGDYSQQELSCVLEQPEVLAEAAKTYVEYCHTKGRHTLVYCVTKKLCAALLGTIRSLLPAEEQQRVTMLTGDMSQSERDEILNKFRNGEILGIINCMVLTEGTDLPICDTILNLRLTCNDTLYQQIIGRGTRLYDGKDYCLIVDLVPEDASNTRNLFTAPKLFGVDPSILNDKYSYSAQNEEIDLLSFCKAASDYLSEYVNSLEITVQNISLFVGKREEMITASNGNMKSLSRNYENEYCHKTNTDTDTDTDAKEDEVDFGNIAYETQADGEHYYRIKPNYFEKIYISKPDVLGNVNVEFHVHPLYMHVDNTMVYYGKMKIDDAIKLTKQYCALQNPAYEYSWNIDLQKEWANTRITDKQYKKICSFDKKYPINHWTVEGLSKLEASRLIDMFTEMTSKKDFLKVYGEQKNDTKKKKEERKKKYMDEFDRIQEQRTVGEKAFEDFCEKTRVLFEKHEQEKSQKRQNLLRFRKAVSFYTRAELPASEKQVAYAYSLYRIFHDKKNGRFKTKPVFENMSRREVAVYIEFLKDTQYRIPQGAGYYLVDDLINVVPEIKDLTQDVAMYNIVCTLCDEDPDTED